MMAKPRSIHSNKLGKGITATGGDQHQKVEMAPPPKSLRALRADLAKHKAAMPHWENILARTAWAHEKARIEFWIQISI